MSADAAIGATRPLTVEVAFDAVCPWCYLGKRRLDLAMAARPEVALEVRWTPFLLDPDMPAEGVPRREYLAARFGGTERAERVLADVVRAGEGIGVAFDFGAIRTTPNTVASHRLIRLARAHGRGGAAVEAVFAAHFVQGRDIGAADILTEIGTEIGLDRAAVCAHLTKACGTDDDAREVREASDRARRSGVVAIPTFTFGGHLTVAGALPAPALARAIDAAAAWG